MEDDNEVEGIIRMTAETAGIDPDVAISIYRKEGLPKRGVMAFPLRWFCASFRYRAGLMRCRPGTAGGTWVSAVPANNG